MQKHEITSAADFEKALARLDDIWSSRPGDAHWTERSVLVQQISAYEARHVEMQLPDSVDAIQFRMEQSGLRPKDLIPFIGSASKVSEVLSGQRSLSKEMIRQLHKGLGIPLASLLGVSEQVPRGYVQVDWVIPTYIAENIANAAKERGLTEEEWVTNRLGLIPIASSDGKTFTERPKNTHPELATFDCKAAGEAA